MLNNINSPINSINTFLKHPIFLIAVIGILVRLFIFPFTEVGYDSDFWATIIRNIRSGEGLYGLEGYYYTPVWGYMLSFLSILQGLFLNIDVIGVRIAETFPMESYANWFFSATVTSVAFNFWIKVPLLISDLLVGYLVYWIIKDKTKDMKKATIGFTLWFLCPLVICITSISGMFDTFSVLFTLLCVIMVRKDKLFIAGILIAFAVLTKFFPVYLVFMLVAYIIVKHRDDGQAVKAVIIATAGALLAFFILMAPQIIEGSLLESILFITTRMSGDGNSTLIGEIASKGAVITYFVGIVVSLIFAYLLSKKSKDEVDDSFFKYALLMMAFVFIYPPTPQYLVLLIPFLVIYIVIQESKLKLSWLLISFGGMFFILSGNFTLFLSFGTFTDLASLEYIMTMIAWFQVPILWDMSPMHIMYNISGVIQYIGVISILLFFLKEKYNNDLKEKDRRTVRPFNLSHFFSYK